MMVGSVGEDLALLELVSIPIEPWEHHALGEVVMQMESVVSHFFFYKVYFHIKKVLNKI